MPQSQLLSPREASLSSSAPARAQLFRSSFVANEESLVADRRSRRSPAQEVEERLIGKLKRVFLPLSHVRLNSLCQGRTHCGYE